MVYFGIAISIISSFLIIFYKNRIAEILGIYDNPNSTRKLHIKPVPAIGGTVLISSLILFFVVNIITDPNNLSKYLLLILFFSVSYLIGLFDDKQKLNINIRIILIISNSLFLLIIDPSLTISKIYINNPNSVILVNNYFLSYLITIFCIFLLYNAINFLDGVNGNLILLSIFWISIFTSKSSLYPSISLILIITLLICLIYNLRNEIFMGNSGSLLVSFIIAYLFLSSHGNEYKIFFSEEIVVLFLIPGLDMMRLFFLRLANNKSPFQGDQNHLHHLLLRKLKKKGIFIQYFVISLIPYIFYIFANINIFLLLVLVLLYFLTIIKFLSGFSYNNKIL